LFKIIYYQNKKGDSELLEFIQELNEKAATNKDARIALKQIVLYINILEKVGTLAGEPFVKHIEGTFWELRPGRNRILFFSLHNNNILLLHCFLKSTRKTPKSEILKAKREVSDWMERNDQNGK
jgi:phage-related protein